MERTVLVTGGTGGLGHAVTRALLDDGWRVVVPWVVEKELERVSEHERLTLVRADLMDPDSAAGAVAAASDGLGALVNLVGGFAMGGRVHETAVDEFEAQLRLNLRPTYLMCAAVLAFVDALDAEYRDDGIRANAVLPSTIDTEANRRAMPDADFERWVKPEEIARVIAFLCSDEARVTSGGHIPVYGRA